MIADFEKYTYEKFAVECDFTNNLATGETITLASSSVTIFDSDGENVTSTLLVDSSTQLDSTSKKLQAKVQTGTVDAIYTVKFKILTTSNNKFQEDKTLYIKYETS